MGAARDRGVIAALHEAEIKVIAETATAVPVSRFRNVDARPTRDRRTTPALP